MSAGFELLRPGAAPFLIVALLLGVLGAFSLAWRSRARRQLVSRRHFRRFLPDFSERRAWLRVVLVMTGALGMAIALLGPVRGYTLREIQRLGVDLVVCIDTSRSMLVQDLKPDRLTRAHREVRGLLDHLEGDRVGVIAFSGDKLLGGVQAGLVLGREVLVQKLRKHPLYRALRLDKGTLALLEETLSAYLDPAHVPERIPTVRMLEESKDEIRTRAEYTLARLKLSQDSCFTCELRETESLAGGGVLPELTLPSLALVLKHKEQSAQQLQARLREASVPVIPRIQDEHVWLDFRTVLPGDLADLADALNALCLQN